MVVENYLLIRKNSEAEYRKLASESKRRPKSIHLRAKNRRLPTDHLLPLEEFVFHRPQIEPPFSPNEYKHQETMLFKVDHYLDDIISLKGRKGTMSGASIAGPPSLFEQVEAWNALSDLCDGASLLLNRRGHGKAEASMDQFFSGLEQLFSLRNLSFMSIFWNICMQLRGIEHRWSESRNLHKFFVKVQQLVSSRGGNNEHPLFVIASLMCEVKNGDFKDTLRICFFKTVNTLMAILGDNDPVVLHLLCTYYGHFHWEDKAYPQKHQLMQKLRDRTELALRSGCEEAIFTAQYSAAYAAYHVCGWRDEAIEFSREILRRVCSREIPLTFTETWTPAARAFFFATKLLMWESRLEQEPQYFIRFAEYAISKFESGGSEHCIRAYTLSASLETHYQKQGRWEDVLREQDRMRRLLNKVSGYQICLHCRERERSWVEYLQKNPCVEVGVHPKLTMCVRCYMALGNLPRRRKKRYKGIKGVPQLRETIPDA